MSSESHYTFSWNLLSINSSRILCRGHILSSTSLWKSANYDSCIKVLTIDRLTDMDLRGQWGPDMSDHENGFFDVFFLKEENVTYPLIWPNLKILIVAKVFEGQHPRVILLYSRFSFAFVLKTKIYLLLHFSSNHLETFRKFREDLPGRF